MLMLVHGATMHAFNRSTKEEIMAIERYIRSVLPIAISLALLVFIGIPAAHGQQQTDQTAPPPAAPASPPATVQVEVPQQVANVINSIRLNYAFQLYWQSRNTGSGPDKTDTTNDIYFRRDRLMVSGQLDDVYGFYAAYQFMGDERVNATGVSDTPQKNFDVIDTFFTADYTDAFRLRAGLTKDPMIREQNESCFVPLSLDRSLFDYPNLPRLNRDFGLVLWGNIADALIQYRIAAMKGNDDVNDPKSELRYTARIHVSLLDPEYSLVYNGTYLGKKKVLTIGAGYQSESSAVYGNVAGKTMAEDYKAYTYDVFFEYPTKAGTITASGAYLQTDFGGAYKGADPDPRSIGINGEKSGWYTKVGYLFPNAKLQIFGRYEQWKFAELNGIFDQKITWTGYGVNYYVKGQDLRLTLEYSTNDFDKEDTLNKDFNTTTIMLQFRI